MPHTQLMYTRELVSLTFFPVSPTTYFFVLYPLSTNGTTTQTVTSAGNLDSLPTPPSIVRQLMQSKLVHSVETVCQEVETSSPVTFSSVNF